jgi:hypothetical protein
MTAPQSCFAPDYLFELPAPKNRTPALRRVAETANIRCRIEVRPLARTQQMASDSEFYLFLSTGYSRLLEEEVRVRVKKECVAPIVSMQNPEQSPRSGRNVAANTAPA